MLRIRWPGLLLVKCLCPKKKNRDWEKILDASLQGKSNLQFVARVDYQCMNELHLGDDDSFRA